IGGKLGGGMFGGLTSGASGLGGALSKLGPYGMAAAAALGALVGVGLSLKGIAALVSGQAEAIDGLAKTADRAGMSMETFQGFNLAAGLAGVETAAFGNSLTKLQKNLVDAADGTGPAAEAFAKMGLNANQLRAMGVDNAMLEIADGIQ